MACRPRRLPGVARPVRPALGLFLLLASLALAPACLASGAPAPGTLLWRYPTRDWVQSSPAVGPKGTIYVGSDDNLLYAFKPDGSLEWTYRPGDIVYSSPAVAADGTVYVGSADGHLYPINPDGTVRWR